MIPSPRFAEFFCGGGMVRAGLAGWDCVFANDIDPAKCRSYRDNWGAHGLVEGDVGSVDTAPLRRPMDLYWASSPCQDFSLAGRGEGLAGARSGVFSSWIRTIRPVIQAGFAPKIIAFENVVGLLTRRGGADFRAVIADLQSLGYVTGALEINAQDFLPQSRPRLFVVCLRADLASAACASDAPYGPYATPGIARFVAEHRRSIGKDWRWWRVDAPKAARVDLDALIEPSVADGWFSPDKVAHLLSMMSPPSRARVEAARAAGETRIGTLYRRGRPDGTGRVRQRAEVRFDGVAGCLRTPAGGSSKQTLLFVRGKSVSARLLTSREAVRLMGLPDAYKLPDTENGGYKIAGDGVAVPVVAHLDATLFRPLLAASRARTAA